MLVKLVWVVLGLLLWPVQYVSEFLRYVVNGMSLEDRDRLRPWFIDRIRR